MGQTSIARLNKTGYSMFWNAMWDNKVNYSRFLKEDLYINDFFNLIFNDNMSLNIFNFKKINFKSNHNYVIFQNINNHQSLFKYISSLNKISYFSSKLWILRYQKWVIFFYFLYIEKTPNNKKLLEDIFNYNLNYSFFLKNYFNFSNSTTINYKFWSDGLKKNEF